MVPALLLRLRKAIPPPAPACVFAPFRRGRVRAAGPGTPRPTAAFTPIKSGRSHISLSASRSQTPMLLRLYAPVLQHVNAKKPQNAWLLPLQTSRDSAAG